MMSPSLCYASKIGARVNNEDRIGYVRTKHAELLIVADGMGGHHFGETAATVATNSLIDSFHATATPFVDNMRHFLQNSLHRANNAILAYAQQHHLIETPRTTIVVCLLQHETALWAHAGDSRLYFFRQGRLKQVTVDHSRVQLLVQAGSITAAEARLHPEKHKVYSCLGLPKVHTIEYSAPVPLQQGDCLLLCSDGFWSHLSTAEMAQFLQITPLDTAITHMLDLAQERGGCHCDNVSILARTWSTMMPYRLSTPTESIETLQLGHLDECTQDELDATIADIHRKMGKQP